MEARGGAEAPRRVCASGGGRCSCSCSCGGLQLQLQPRLLLLLSSTKRGPLDQARVDKWIRDRLVAEVPGLCWHCRKPFIVGQRLVVVSDDEVIVRFHAQCESEWRREQEAAARRALGLRLARSIHET